VAADRQLLQGGVGLQRGCQSTGAVIVELSTTKDAERGQGRVVPLYSVHQIVDSTLCRTPNHYDGILNVFWL
jgi:hypothetical protein